MFNRLIDNFLNENIKKYYQFKINVYFNYYIINPEMIIYYETYLGIY